MQAAWAARTSVVLHRLVTDAGARVFGARNTRRVARSSMRAALRRPDGTLIELTETVDLVLGREDVDESFGDLIHISRKERGQVSVRYENGSWRVTHRTRSDIPSGWQAGGAEEWELLKSNYSRELNHGDRIALNKTFDPATIFTFLEQDGSRLG